MKVAQLRGAAHSARGGSGSVPGPALSQTSARGIPRALDDRASQASLLSRLSAGGGSAPGNYTPDGVGGGPVQSMDDIVNEAVSEALGSDNGCYAMVPAHERLRGVLDASAADAARVCKSISMHASAIAAAALYVDAPPKSLGSFVACLVDILALGATTDTLLWRTAADALADVGAHVRIRDEEAAKIASWSCVPQGKCHSLADQILQVLERQVLPELAPLLLLDGLDAKRHAILKAVHGFLPCDVIKRDASVDALRAALSGEDDVSAVRHTSHDERALQLKMMPT